jgi:hypothetical protein
MKCVVMKKGRNELEETYWTGTYTPKGRPQQTSLVHRAAHFENPEHAYRVCRTRKVLQRWSVGWRPEEIMH